MKLLLIRYSREIGERPAGTDEWHEVKWASQTKSHARISAREAKFLREPSGLVQRLHIAAKGLLEVWSPTGLVSATDGPSTL